MIGALDLAGYAAALSLWALIAGAGVWTVVDSAGRVWWIRIVGR